MMLCMTHVIKPWKESGALNAHINLYGFWNQGIFLTKSGDLGLVVKVRGVDYESLAQTAQEYAVKRLEAAMKVFGPGFHVYQYLFKTNRPTIPFQTYGDPIVNAAVEQRKEFFAQKLDCLFDVEIFYAVVIEGARSKTGITRALAQILFDPAAAMGELKAQFSNDKMKEAIAETRPLVLKQLLEIEANFCVITEWVPMDVAIARKEIIKRKRHFNISKISFITSMQRDPASYDPRNTIIDDSKQADIENLGDCLRTLGEGQALGEFSLTVVLYAENKKSLDKTLPEAVRVFTGADGSLFAETYNQLNAYFATIPGNYQHNLRKLYLLNSNYADLSFLFTILPGERRNEHLDAEYLAVLET